MISVNKTIVRSRRGGQTLIIALIILGVLLIVGFVFLGIVNRNIVQQSTHRQRTLSGELAEAGIRYCHQQLLTSELGADWHGTPTPLASGKDPDADLLGDPVKGPDGLGPFTRVNFASGRALVRVRYTPTDLSLFQTNPLGALAKPGKARSYLIIEAYGRPGVVNATDPTINGKNTVKDQSKLIAFCPIGIIESARYITDKFRETRPADIGSPDLAVKYQGGTVNVPQVLGDITPFYSFYNRITDPTPSATAGSYPAFGSIYSNTGLRINGNLTVNVSSDFGDFIRTADILTAADGNSSLTVNSSKRSGTTYTTSILKYGAGGTVPLDSRDPAYDTDNGIVRDGFSDTDANGNPRGISRKEPPSLLTVDPATGVSRYLKMSRESGTLVNGGNSGRFGHGRNVYVNNPSDLQLSTDEQGRIDTGSAQSLEYDWLNPNNSQQKSGWVGPFYIPRGAYLHLLTDGFTITRDPKGPAAESTWMNPDGTSSGLSTLRFRLGKGSDGHLHILNTLTSPSNINGALTTASFNTGPRFDGVLYFDGNVRVRGIIPTDVQLSVVSGGTIYVEGSITKGSINGAGARITSPSLSALGLLARQYVCLNTTAFFGPDAASSPEEVNGVPNAVGYAPVRLRQPDGSIRFDGEELLDPDGGTPNMPSTWKPYAIEYTEAGTSSPLNQWMLVTHTMDDGPAAAAFVGLDINKGLPDYALGLTDPYASDRFFQTYLFDTASGDNLSSATAYFGPNYVTPGYDSAKTTGQTPLYGLGGQSWQRYSKFETTSWPIVQGGSAYPVATPIPIEPYAFHAPDAHGTYLLLPDQVNIFGLTASSFGGASSNDYLVARAGLMPHDIRIEATMYAEEGSFFVIPGPWFNPNPNDLRDTYTDPVTRKINYGNNLPAPFYNEPIDVRVRIIGAVSENMPPPMSVQMEWLKKWGWIPMQLGATGHKIPTQHLGPTADPSLPYVPNLTIAYDPMLATGQASGFTGAVLRTDDLGRALPPIPRLPVSPSLAYFGQVNP